MAYRFRTSSDLDGHAVGNLILTAMLDITGSLKESIKHLSKLLDVRHAKCFYNDLIIGTNEYGTPELMFKNKLVAETFAKAALACSKIYISDEDRYAMQLLAEILKYAIEHQIISEDDLYSTEPEVIGKFLSDERTASLWNSFCIYRQITSAPQPGATGCWRKIAAKKRFIDPMVQGEGRISELSSEFADSLNAFRKISHDYWVCGQH